MRLCLTMNRSSLMRFIMLCGLLLAPAKLFAEEATIRLAVGEWLPFMSKSLAGGGPVCRLITELFARHGIRVEYEYFPWARALALGTRKNFNGTAVWGISADRINDYLFSDAIFEDDVVFFSLRTRNFTWDTLADLKNTRITGTLDYNYGDVFQAAEKQGLLQVERTNDDEVNFSKVFRGRADVTLQERRSGYAIINKIFDPEHRKLFVHHPKPVRRATYHLLLNRMLPSNDRYIKLFNMELAKDPKFFEKLFKKVELEVSEQGK